MLATPDRSTISIHALREEGDIGSGEVLAPTPNFYPRPPRGGRPRGSRRNNKMGDFYPRPPRGGRRSAVRPGHRQRRISIHALREEGDITATSATDCGLNFYPRPPRGGRRDPEFKNIQRSLFLSTPSARRATEFAAQIFVGCRNFYPRPPRGGRPAVAGHRPLDERISIHALREEGDATGCLCVSVSHNFYPRPPRGGRRAKRWPLATQPPISIHALREEGDRCALCNRKCEADFYPRPPRGGRHLRDFGFSQQVGFLSTPSARRATDQQAGHSRRQMISIHALREEGDDQLCFAVPNAGYFYPRPPRGGRLPASS